MKKILIWIFLKFGTFEFDYFMSLKTFFYKIKNTDTLVKQFYLYFYSLGKLYLTMKTLATDQNLSKIIIFARNIVFRVVNIFIEKVSYRLSRVFNGSERNG